MIMIATKQVAKSYGYNPVLENITIEVKAGERIGIVGPNGAGKTTFFRLLAGLETPDAGEVFRAKGSRLAYLPQSPSYPDGWSGRKVIESAFAEVLALQAQMRQLEEEMAESAHDASRLERLMHWYQEAQERFEHLNGYQSEATIAQVVTGLGIPGMMLDTPFAQLSGGEQTKIGLAKLLCERCDVLLLDEPTNHLDVEAMEWLESFLCDYPGTVLIISHDRYFLDAVVTDIYEVDGGEITTYLGNYSFFVKEKEERLLRQFAEYEEQQKKIKKMQETIKRLKEWGNRSNPPNEAFHRRAKSMEKALARIERIEKPKLEADRMDLVFRQSDRSGEEVLIAEDVHKSFGDKPLFRQAQLRLRYGERKALLGPNGCGKSTMIKMLLGEQAPDQGTVKLGSSVKVGYLSQHAFTGEPKRRVIDLFRDTVAVSEGEARHRLARFLFYGEQVFKKLEHLSGGERMRLRLAQLMHQEINLLILDEPTNHLDIEARETLEEALADFQGSLLIVSHDRYFLQKTVDGVFWIDQGAIVHYEGTYEEAREKRKQTLMIAPVQTAKVQQPEKAAPYLVAAEKQERQGKRVNPYKLAELERKIAEREQEKARLQSKMAEPHTAYEVLIGWQKELDCCQQELDMLMESWMELQED
ncbi:ribosomal protection-like ABC-F family protein [Brevibacillus migulae]|uniref:ribosomal protection-like ABC-F family protein n=1 Tax=Brevibacillus migulae TaxID=1644114 RepID=UPI00106E796D|nr:ABC-F type ribosomal protection protein [Brevibacillus migulae]